MVVGFFRTGSEIVGFILLIERISVTHPMILLISKGKCVLQLYNLWILCLNNFFHTECLRHWINSVSNIPVNKEKLVQVLTFFTRKNCSFACAYTFKILLWVCVVWAAQLLQILKYMRQGENNPLICKHILSIVKHKKVLNNCVPYLPIKE